MYSPGEQRFAAYLGERKLPYRYEEAVGGRNPDFLIGHPNGDISCEVYEPVFRLSPGRMGSFNLYPPLRKAFRGRKYDQAKEAREAGMSFVLVRVRTHSDIAFDPIIVAGAMFGDISVSLTIALDPDLPPPEQQSGFVFGSGAQLQETRKRAVSAVALPRTFNPTRRAVDLAYRERKQAIGNGDAATWTFEERMGAWDLMTATEEEFAAKAVYDDAARASRVIVLHNPYGDIRLDKRVFSGPWDEQFDVSEDGAYTLVVPAERTWELPD